MKELNKIGVIMTKFVLVVCILTSYIVLVMEIRRQIDNFWFQMLLNIPIAFLVGGLVSYLLLSFPEPPPFNPKMNSKWYIFSMKSMMALGIMSISIVLGLRVRRNIDNFWLELLFHAFSGFIVGGLVTYVLFKFPQPPSSNPKNSLNMKKDKESKSSLDTDQ